MCSDQVASIALFRASNSIQDGIKKDTAVLVRFEVRLGISVDGSASATLNKPAQEMPLRDLSAYRKVQEVP
jgi:hypothetical protein